MLYCGYEDEKLSPYRGLNKGEIIMRKVRFAAILLIAFMVCQLAVFASPETIGVDEAGNSNGLIVITKPKNQKHNEKLIIFFNGFLITFIQCITIIIHNNFIFTII